MPSARDIIDAITLADPIDAIQKLRLLQDKSTHLTTQQREPLLDLLSKTTLTEVLHEILVVLRRFSNLPSTCIPLLSAFAQTGETVRCYDVMQLLPSIVDWESHPAFKSIWNYNAFSNMVEARTAFIRYISSPAFNDGTREREYLREKSILFLFLSDPAIDIRYRCYELLMHNVERTLDIICFCLPSLADIIVARLLSSNSFSDLAKTIIQAGYSGNNSLVSLALELQLHYKH